MGIKMLVKLHFYALFESFIYKKETSSLYRNEVSNPGNDFMIMTKKEA